MSQNSYPVNTEPAFQKNDQVEEEAIDIKQFIVKALHYWYYFAISALICLLIAWLLARYATPVWHVQSKIMVKDSKSSPASAMGGSMGADLSSVLNVKSNADNEIQILKTRSLMQKAVEDMQLNVRTYKIDGFKSKEVFAEAPFTVQAQFKADTLKSIKYDIKVLSADRFLIKNDDEGVNKEVNFNQTIRLPQLDLVLKKLQSVKTTGTYRIAVQSIDATINDFAKAYSVKLSDKQATTIDLSLDYPHPKKGEVILDRIMHLYLLSNLQNEVVMADSTMAFINARIAIVGKELNSIEKEFERYKSSNNLANIEEQSKSLVLSAREYYDKLNQQEVQLSVVRDLERYVNSPNKKMIPSSLALSTADQSFGQAINSYNDLLINRDKALLSYTEDNPVVQNIDQQIESARRSLLNSVNSYKTSLLTARNQLQKQNADFTGQLKDVPAKERNYLDYARQQNLKEQLYLYLLQKREETAISKTSTLSSSRIIDPAKGEFNPYKPKKFVLYMIGLVIGLILPALYLLLKELFNVRITTKSDIEKGTTAPIIGEIGRNTDKYALVTAKNSRSVVSEQFRAVRTNLQFILNTEKSNVLLFTSSMSGEGKSFISLNIGAGLALAGKKVAIMELDLRKPKLSESINLSNQNGFSNYVSTLGDEVNLDRLLQPSGFHENAFIVSSGPIPPNPAELLMSPKTEKLIDALKGRFDYVIIDCAPIGLVTDALLLEKFADATLYVVRQNYTYKNQLTIISDLQKKNKVKHLYLIVNDIKTEVGGYSSYTQGYGYGYGYGVEAKRSKWKDFLGFKI